MERGVTKVSAVGSVTSLSWLLHTSRPLSQLGIRGQSAADDGSSAAAPTLPPLFTTHAEELASFFTSRCPQVTVSALRSIYSSKGHHQKPWKVCSAFKASE